MKNSLLAIVGVVVLLGILVYIGTGGFSTITAGFRVESISSTAVSFNDVKADDYFLISVVADGAAQSIYGAVDRNTFAEYGYVNEDLKRFTIKLTGKEETIKYTIVKDAQRPVYNYWYRVMSPSGLFSTFKEAPPCDTKNLFAEISADNYPYISFLFKEDRFCIYRSAIGQSGKVTPTSLNYRADFLYQVEGEEAIPMTIYSSDDGSKTKVFGNQESIAFTGTVGTGNLVDTNDYRGIFNVEGEWHIVEMEDWRDYDNFRDNFERNVKNAEWVKGFSSTDLIDKQLDYLTRELQGAAWRVADPKYKVSLGLNEQTSGTESSGTLTWVTKTTINNPRFLLRIKASSLGVAITSGQPKIVDADCDEFQSGDEAYSKVIVKNIGDNTGSFDVSFTECDFRPVFDTPAQQVAAGDTATFNIRIDPNAAGDLEDSCKITVTDDEGASDSTSVTCKSTAPTCGAAGQQFVIGLCVEECKEDGSIQQAFCCQDGSYPFLGDDDKYQCGSKFVCEDGAIVKDPEDCKTPVNWALLIISSVLGLIAGSIVFGYTKPILKVSIKKYGVMIAFTLAVIAFLFVFFLIATTGDWFMNIFVG